MNVAATKLALAGLMLLTACTEKVEVLALGDRSGRPANPNDAAAPTDASGVMDGSAAVPEDGETPSSDAGASPDAGLPALPAPDLLYRFDEGAGTRVLDTSNQGALYHLTIADPTRVTWLAGALRIDQPTIVSSSAPATELVEACKQSNSLSIEAWVTPAQAAVEGTRRIVSVSSSTGIRNFLLGQGGLEDEGPVDSFTMRLRTTSTNSNGVPALSSAAGTAATTLTHVVAVHRSNGSERIFVNGAQSMLATRAGTFNNWDETLRIHVGNELASPDDSRAFLGEIYLVAVYCTPLSAEQVAQLFALGTSR